MRRFLEIFIIAWMSISWRSINQVYFSFFFQNNFCNNDLIYRTLAQHCHNIERLDLSDCKKITDQAIYAISKHCAKLTAINLESCINITDKSLKNIADGCPVRRKIKFIFERKCICLFCFGRIYWKSISLGVIRLLKMVLKL